MILIPEKKIFESVHQPVCFLTAAGEKKDLGSIRGKRVCLVSGLGDNDSFLDTVKALGADSALNFFFMDHHRYTKDQISHIIAKCKAAHIDNILTTEKDGVKLKYLVEKDLGIELLILKIRLKIKDEDVFFKRISSIFSR